MNISAVRLIFFSPTKTTQKVLEGIAQGTEVGTIKHLDLTPTDSKTPDPDEMQDELILLGVPVYSGRVPLAAVAKLQRLRADGMPAVLELKDLARECGFVPIAGGAFIGEHSFANNMTHIANGRPDEEDLIKAKEFGLKIRGKIKDIDSIDIVSQLEVPRNSPYKKGYLALL